jgi:hypothetical protein
VSRTQRRKKVNGIIREANRIYKIVSADGHIDKEEAFELMSVLQEAVDQLQGSLVEMNPQQCYAGYTTGLTFGKKMSDSQITKQAEKDGFDPDMVLFLARNMETVMNPKPGRNLGYGTTNGGMARNQLRTINRISKDFHDMIMKGDELPDWVLSKITVAQDRLETARNYIASKLENM